MTKKSQKNNHLRIDLSNILKRLPLLQQLNSSQSALIDFSLTWQQWSKKNLNANFLQSTALNSFRDGILTISCTSPIAASQLKHLQVSLLSDFHSNGFTKIKQIKIQVDHKHAQDDHGTALHGQESTPQPSYKPLKADSIAAINNCKNTIKNEKLSNSLAKLADTLAGTHNLKKGDGEK